MLKLTCVCLFLCVVLGLEIEKTKSPNIVIIMADDLGWNDLGYHGSNEIPTPNIDALAYNGIMLERHYVSPTCTPSRSAFYTGKYPFRIGMQGTPIGAGQPRGIPLSETLLPQYLQSLGYTTHLVGKWHVGSHTTKHTPTYRGFDSFFGYWMGYLGYYDGIHVDLNKLGSGTGIGLDAHRNNKDAWHEFVGHYATDLFTKEAIKIIQDHDPAKPLYLQVAHLATHSGNGVNRLEVRDKAETLKKFEYIKDYNRRLYAGMVEALDDSVGQIVSSLKAAGLLENSIVVFMSDNGAPTVDPLWNTNNDGSNWPLRGTKASVHEGGVRVPAMIYSPLLSNTNTSTELFHMTDWLPTLYQAAGGNLSNLGIIDGVSQWDVLRSDEKCFNRRKYLVLDIDETFGNEALIYGHWKIIRSNENSRINFTNFYYGSSGRDRSLPKYNLTSIITSPTNVAINGNNEPNIDYFKQKRRQGTIDSKCKLVVDKNTDNVKLCSDYCLFNIYRDPCETTDVSSKHQAILKNLESVLVYFNITRIPRNNFTIDTNSEPTLWNNRWVSWLDPKTAKLIQAENCSKCVLDSTWLVVVLVFSLLSRLYVSL